MLTFERFLSEDLCQDNFLIAGAIRSFFFSPWYSFARLPVGKEPEPLRHLLKIGGMSAAAIHRTLDRAQWWKETTTEYRPLKGKTVANLFFEPSTRTQLSFALAAQRLGAHVLYFQSEGSSLAKGESLLDTVQTIEAMGADVLVIRHQSNDVLPQILPDVSSAIVNAGTGTSEHPTQALLDLLTIRQHFGQLSGLTVGIVGDVLHSRVAMSNILALRECGAKLVFSGPTALVPVELTQFGAILPIDDLIDQVDVLMLLRIQLERHGQNLNLDPSQYHRAYGLTDHRVNRLKDEAIILHPGPVNRGVEIASHLVTHPKSRILTQVNNGVYARMAVLEEVVQGQPTLHLSHQAS